MNFTSIDFLIFFPATVLVYFLFPPKIRWVVLLASSYFFYINVKPVYVFLLLGVTTSTYFLAILMGSTRNENRRRAYAITNIILVLLPLGFYKYFPDINTGMRNLLQHFGLRWPLPDISLILPIGISFYTFTSIGYTMDVYNEEIEPERHFGIFSLFISFFPLLLAGPIERAPHMLPQFRKPHRFNYDMAVSGFRLMLWGYLMKLVAADRIHIYLYNVMADVPRYSGFTLLVASYLHPFEIYADFGGYSLIAMGCARVLGLEVMNNFNRPFFATSIAELWRRWHISLILWLTDYVYTPLAFYFRRFKIWGIVISIIITFVLSGLWHAAAWTFLTWGLLQGIFLSVEALTRNRRDDFQNKYQLRKKRWFRFLSILTTITLLAASDIFGNAKDVPQALEILHKIVTHPVGHLFLFEVHTFVLGVSGALLILVKDFLDEYYPDQFHLMDHRNPLIRYFAYSSIVLLILLFGVFD
ncbi:MAG: MBOAT family protein, partial [Bacteroidota bacterium]|nr:MBOAT family protein [Bacteroidota bacterium]